MVNSIDLILETLKGYSWTLNRNHVKEPLTVPTVPEQFQVTSSKFQGRIIKLFRLSSKLELELKNLSKTGPTDGWQQFRNWFDPHINF